jgi:hypothetical protein
MDDFLGGVIRMMLTYDSDGRPKLLVTIENLTPTVAVFVAANSVIVDSNCATLDNYIVLDFDDGTNESICFDSIMPQQYRGGDIEVRIHYAMTSATSGDVDWSVKFDRVAANALDIDSASYSTSTSSLNNTVPSTSGQIGIATISVSSGSDMDNIVAGALYRMCITRGASADTATGDAELIAVEIREL